MSTVKGIRRRWLYHEERLVSRYCTMTLVGTSTIVETSYSGNANSNSSEKLNQCRASRLVLVATR